MEWNLSPREQDGEDRDTLIEWELSVRCVLMHEPCGHTEFPTVVRVRPCYLILLSRKERLRGLAGCPRLHRSSGGRMRTGGRGDPPGDKLLAALGGPDC